jgi:hypothetical protein
MKLEADRVEHEGLGIRIDARQREGGRPTHALARNVERQVDRQMPNPKGAITLVLARGLRESEGAPLGARAAGMETIFVRHFGGGELHTNPRGPSIPFLYSAQQKVVAPVTTTPPVASRGPTPAPHMTWLVAATYSNDSNDATCICPDPAALHCPFVSTGMGAPPQSASVKNVRLVAAQVADGGAH